MYRGKIGNIKEVALQSSLRYHQNKGIFHVANEHPVLANLSIKPFVYTEEDS